MNFVADENIDQPAVERRRADGHDVVAIAELEPGTLDEEVLGTAADNGAVLITADTDFGDLVFRQRLTSTGVILMRLPGLSAHAKADTVSRAVSQHSDRLNTAFTVIDPGAVRIRSLPI